ncbi:MAG: hypothetical protein HY893_05680 [Deltaproteobacteria bacterium]|nr:hypothetical protein [Deltaproteobacteria bacterium]
MSLSDLSKRQHAPDLAKQLGADGIRCLLKLMCEAYHELLASGFVQKDTPENTINEQWSAYIIMKWRQNQSISVIPIPQKEDLTRGKKGKRSPTIDFCFRAELYPESYFGAECKLLDEGNKKHIHEYLSDKNGIGRYLDGRYGAKSSAGAMVGYIRVGKSTNVIKDLSGKISTLSGKPRNGKRKACRNFFRII